MVVTVSYGCTLVQAQRDGELSIPLDGHVVWCQNRWTCRWESV